jgi:hypothetical protein
MLAGFASRPWDYCQAEQAVMWPQIAMWCLVRVGIWLARLDWVLLAAAAGSDCRMVIWLAPVRLIMGVPPGVPPDGPGCRTAGCYWPLGGWLPCRVGLSRWVSAVWRRPAPRVRMAWASARRDPARMMSFLARVMPV